MTDPKIVAPTGFHGGLRGDLNADAGVVVVEDFKPIRISASAGRPTVRMALAPPPVEMPISQKEARESQRERHPWYGV